MRKLFEHVPGRTFIFRCNLHADTLSGVPRWESVPRGWELVLREMRCPKGNRDCSKLWEVFSGD